MTTDEIKQSVTMRDVLDKYGIKVNRNGMCCCPLHGEKHPSMKVYADGYKCFACNSAGDVFSFVMEYEHVDFKTAFAILGGTYDHEQTKKKRTIQKRKFSRQKDRTRRIETAIKDLKKLITTATFDCIWMISEFEPLSDEWCFGKTWLPFLEYVFEELYVNENEGVNKANVIRVCQRVRQNANTFGRIIC